VECREIGALHEGEGGIAGTRLQVTCGIHAFMQDANDGDAVRRDAKVNHVVLNAAVAVAGANVFASWGAFGRFGQHLKCSSEGICIAVSLI
jgi:hypothetical protein